MSNVNSYDKAHELARAITKSEPYLNYCQAKKEVEKKPEWKSKLLELRQRQAEFNRAQILGNDVPKETVQELSLEFARINQIKEIAEFFRAETAFVQMFNDIQEIINKAIESGLEA
jgi:cell fate (sporulation/competence/biofilm development) regulator YlbF (YheA/YmcA/DUF963 family)